ncbi:DUF6716 putative glycosyltransferase [Enemella evansiae]|uniref:DUF6716 putative glycosyltransferase n=1 Tax=Enemella evansiae TaxID=2016499 RepID=UPI000B96B1DC|nr:DUF6716 putative glycosyltransferase [Enemella evansiae]OYO01310.1 hypothetical protein CGZ97_17965 [Enemella evansiae]OYO07440.1 hypothetical protein CGZ98_18455 [Enemella evansiae]
MRILTVSDSDSFLKWATATFEEVPADWRVRHLVLDNVIAPSAAQVTAVRGGFPTERGGVRRLVELAGGSGPAGRRPDAIVLACTGPALEVVMSVLARSGALRARPGRPRPVLVGGLPGISYPANDLAIRHRRDLDLMLLHSHREVAAYAEVVGRLGGPELALATLPFLAEVRRGLASAAPVRDRRAVVFAAQSLVPAAPADRQRILTALERLPTELDPVVKVRAVAGERQAHNEAYPYQRLWAERPDHLRELDFRAGRMADALAGAYGFATVSSTAAIEAIAAGVPSLVLGDFGVSAELINLVFTDSGLIGTLDDLSAGRFRDPDPSWLRDNYFQPESDNTWRQRLETLVQQRSALPPVRFRGLGGLLPQARRFLRLLPDPRNRSAG